jgi:hypothetical protein
LWTGWPRVAFSVDGSSIIIETRRNDLQQWDATTGAEIATQPANILACGAIERLAFNQPRGCVIDLTTGRYLLYPTVPRTLDVCSTSSQTSLAFATLANIYIIHFPPWMLSL